MLPFKNSFRLSKDKKLESSAQNQAPQTAVLVSPKKIIDSKRRSFLKTLGMVGAGVVGASILPKKSSAMTMGAKPGIGVLGVKNSSGTSIDPSTQATLDSSRVATQATKISFDSIRSNTDTLVTNSNKFAFTGSNLNAVKASGSDNVSFLDQVKTDVSGISEDAVVMLRRIVKLMESKATIDSSNRRRVALDAWGENITGPIDTGTATGAQILMQLVDTSKYNTWIDNKWQYFAVKITAGTGVGQLRRIASNTSTALTLDLGWSTLPDDTSVYGIYDISVTVLEAGFATGTQGLLTLTDTTRNWSVNGWANNYAVRIKSDKEGEQIRLITSNTATDLTLLYPWTPVLGLTDNLETGTATADESFSILVDSSKTWTDNIWTGSVVTIIGNTGAGQSQIIASNTATALTLQNNWYFRPDATSTYVIRSMPTDGLEFGNASGIPSDINLFDDLTKIWTDNIWTNYLIKITSGEGANQVRQIVSNTATTLTLATPWSTLPKPSSTYRIYSIPTREYLISLLPATNTDVGTIYSTPRVGTGTDSTIGTVSSISSIAAVGSYATQQRFGDVSHKVYNDSIRRQLTFVD